MMLALIPPIKNLDYSRLSEMDFALADIALSHPEYAEYYAERPKDRWLIMDNGAYEIGAPLPIESLLHAAELLKANEIVAPDFPFRPRKTVTATKEFIASLSKTDRQKYKIMYVPHGKTIDSWRQSYKQAADIDCDVIGLSILLDKKLIPRRAMLEFAIYGKSVIPKPHHLLGLDSVVELKLWLTMDRNVRRYIRSVDTSMPFSRANAGWNIFASGHCLRINLLRDSLYFANTTVLNNVQDLRQVIRECFP